MKAASRLAALRNRRAALLVDIARGRMAAAQGVEQLRSGARLAAITAAAGWLVRASGSPWQKALVALAGLIAAVVAGQRAEDGRKEG